MCCKCKLLYRLRDYIRRQYRLKIKRQPMTPESVTARPMIEDSVNKNIAIESEPKIVKVKHQKKHPAAFKTIMNESNMPELRDHIVQYLGINDLVTLGQVSKIWQTSTERKCHWKILGSKLPVSPNPLKFRDLRQRCPKKLEYLRKSRIMHKWRSEQQHKMKELKHAKGAKSDISEMTSTSDGRLITAYTIERTIVVWDVTSGKQIMQLTHDESPGGVIVCMEVTSDDRILCAVHANWREQREMAVDQRIYPFDHVRVWDLNTEQCLHILSSGNPNKIGWMSVKGNRMVYAYKHGPNDHSFAVYNPREGVCLNTIQCNELGLLYMGDRAWTLQQDRIIFNGFYMWTFVNGIISRWPIDENQPDRASDISHRIDTNYPTIRILSDQELGVEVVAESLAGDVRILSICAYANGLHCKHRDYKHILTYHNTNSEYFIKVIRNKYKGQPTTVFTCRQTQNEPQKPVCIVKVDTGFNNENAKFMIAAGKDKHTVVLFEYEHCIGQNTSKNCFINEFKMDEYVKGWKRPLEGHLLTSTFLAIEITDKAKHRSRLFVVDMNSN